MLFSRVKISCFRAKAHLVFHWCLYNKALYSIQGQCVYHNTIFFTTVYNKTILIGFGFWDTVFPRIIAGGDYFFFHTKRG